MGQFQRRGRAHVRFEFDRPCASEPRFRYRVVLGGKQVNVAARDAAAGTNGAGLEVVWVTNDRDYARALVARINALCGQVRAGVHVWNRAEKAAQSRWIRLRS